MHVASAILISLLTLAIDPPQGPLGSPTGPVAAPARSQLQIGDTPPPLSVDNWLKGDEVAELSRGTVWVVNFWATWSPPSRKNVPQLSTLAKLNPTVRIISIAASETKPEKGEDRRLATARTFVSNHSEEISYTVAFDGDESMTRTWLEPAHQTGLPVAFVVDATGHIVWIGHPALGLSEILPRVVAGKFDAQKARKTSELRAKSHSKLQAKEFDAAFNALDELYALDPDANAGALVLKFTTLTSHLHDDARASALAAELLTGQLKDRSTELQQILTTIVVSPGIKQRDFPLAVRIADRVLELEKAPSPNTLELAAKAYYGVGDRTRAIVTLQKAVDNASGTLHDVLNDVLNGWKNEGQTK